MSQARRMQQSAVAGTEPTYFGPSSNVEFLILGEPGAGDAGADGCHDNVLAHPGEVLQREFLEPNRMSASKLASKLAVPPTSILAILRGTRGISGPMSILLGRAFGVADDFFATLFSRYQVELAAQETRQDLIAAYRVARAQALARELQNGGPHRLS